MTHPDLVTRIEQVVDRLQRATNLLDLLEDIAAVQADREVYLALEACRDCLIALQQPPWRDISTAPKDGTPVWLFASELRDLDYNVKGSAEGFWQDDEGWIVAKWNSGSDTFESAVVQPSHWQPLPPAPTEKTP